MSTDEFHDTVRRQFEAIGKKLDRLDEAIRGVPSNGTRPGILVRLDRLEQNAARQGRLIWLIVGAAITALATGATVWLTGLGGGG